MAAIGVRPITVRPVTPQEQAAFLLRNVDTVLPEGELVERIAQGRPLRVKLGLDPTAPAVTLGWAVVLRKLREFQDLGHTAVLIVGDFTAQVGDPSGRSETRRRLSAEEVKAYAGSVLDDFSKILDRERLEVRYNSEWLASLDMGAILELASSATLAQMLERDDFSNRFAAQQPISIIEFLYPLLQGYDSVAVEADLELGGTDQLFNLVMGRRIQERYGQRAQMVMTMPLLIGTDGTKKMSQSVGNYIGIAEEPFDMFGKIMRIPDELMPQYYELVSNLPWDVIRQTLSNLRNGTLHPNEAKRRLARAVVAQYHGDEAAHAAEDRFDQVFKAKEIPDDIPAFPLPEGEEQVSIPALLRESGLVSSGGEARRLLQQGAIKLNGERIDDERLPAERLAGAVLQAGKRRFVRLSDA